MAHAHLPNRVAQSIDSRHQQVRPPVKQVHCKEEGSSWNPIAAVVRHERSMPGLAERRNALPLFRPTLAHMPPGLSLLPPIICTIGETLIVPDTRTLQFER
jgi:hypothetical protein